MFYLCYFSLLIIEYRVVFNAFAAANFDAYSTPFIMTVLSSQLSLCLLPKFETLVSCLHFIQHTAICVDSSPCAAAFYFLLIITALGASCWFLWPFFSISHWTVIAHGQIVCCFSRLWTAASNGKVTAIRIF